MATVRLFTRAQGSRGSIPQKGQSADIPEICSHTSWRLSLPLPIAFLLFVLLLLLFRLGNGVVPMRLPLAHVASLQLLPLLRAFPLLAFASPLLLSYALSTRKRRHAHEVLLDPCGGLAVAICGLLSSLQCA